MRKGSKLTDEQKRKVGDGVKRWYEKAHEALELMKVKKEPAK